MISERVDQLRSFSSMSVSQQQAHALEIDTLVREFVESDPNEDEFSETLGGLLLTARRMFILFAGV